MKPLHQIPLSHFIVGAIILIGCNKHTAAPSLDVEAMFPTSGPDSTQVSIGGTGFSTTLADNIVSFNGKAATVLSATATGLVVRTPTLCGSGNVTVTVGNKTLTAGFFAYDTTWLQTLITDSVSAPGWLCLDKSGNLYVTSLQTNAVYKIPPAGSMSTFVSLLTPLAQAFDATGNLFVVSNDEWVYKIDGSGNPSFIGTDTGQVLGIAVDDGGNIFLARQFPYSVDLMSPQGVVTKYASMPGFPSGMAISNDGKLYVEASSRGDTTGTGLGTILSFTGPGMTTTFSSGFDYPGETQLAFDVANNLYVPDFQQGTLQSTIKCISPAGTITSIPVPNLYDFIGIVRDAAGHFYVSGSRSATSPQGVVLKLTQH